MTNNLIDEYVEEKTWRVKSNANHNRSFSGLQSHIAGTILAKDAIERYGKIGRRHLDGNYHLHNLEGGIYSKYCNGNDLLGLLQKGLINVGGVTAKPAKHFSAALDQINNFTYLMTGEFQGAQAWRDLDILLAPFVWYDDLDYEDVKQEVQQLVWNLSFNLRPSYQSPFTNITFGLRPSKYYKEMSPIIGGEVSKRTGRNTYEDFQEETDMINRAFLEVMIEGPGENKPFTFPLPTYNITKDFKWNSEIAELIFELASKWGTPYFCLSRETELFIRSKENNRIRKGKIYTVKNDDEVLTPSGFKRVKKTYEYKYGKNLIQIILLNNTDIKCTPNHKLQTIGGLKEAKDITENDRILVSFQEFSNSKNGVNDYNLGKLLGLMVAEGNWNDTRADFPNKDIELINFVRKTCEENFNAFTNVYVNNSNVNVLSINSRALCGFMKDFVVGTVSNNKSLRGFVFNMSFSFREGILDGWILGDGHTTSSGHIIGTSNSFELIKDMNAICTSLGKKSSFSYKYTTKEDNYLSHPIIYNLHITKTNKFYHEKNGKFYIKVKEIKSSKSIADKVFDIEIDDEEHLFVLANGIVSHNSNYINSDISEEDSLSMCCRLKLNLKEVQKVSGGIWNFGSNTGSLSVFTINMPRLGYLAGGKEKKFYRLLDEMLEDGKKYLLAKKKCIRRGGELGLFPMTQKYVGDKLLKTYFLTIGINGLNECAMNMHEGNILEYSDWCEAVLVHIRSKVLGFQQGTGQLFNFEATPAEGCSYSLARLDKEKFPDIFTQGDEDAPYYTGSSLIPYNIDVSLPDAVKHQEKLQRHYTGGTVFHVDLGELAGGSAIKDLIRGMCTHSTLPYITWSPSYSICPIHGKSAGKDLCCKKAETYSRVVGYYRSINRWNVGKKKEFEEKKFLRK